MYRYLTNLNSNHKVFALPTSDYYISLQSLSVCSVWAFVFHFLAQNMRAASYKDDFSLFNTSVFLCSSDRTSFSTSGNLLTVTVLSLYSPQSIRVKDKH